VSLLLRWVPAACTEEGSKCTSAKSFWDVTTREPVILTLLAIVAIGFVVVSLISRAPGWRVPQAVIGFYLLGAVFPIGSESYSNLQIGFWLATVGAVIMAVGGSLAVALAMNPQWRAEQRARLAREHREALIADEQLRLAVAGRLGGE
jgi:hypothetical protein